MKDFRSFVSEADIKKETKTEIDGKEINSHNIVYPSFLMCPPFNLSSDEPNNTFMKKIPPSERKVDKKKALRQFLNFYNYMASESLVYLIPHVYDLQDQSFVANLGIVLPHYEHGHTVVISEFRSPPRVDEQRPGVEFFKMLNFDVKVSPAFFEGEADLKYINGNNYIGAYGIRSSLEALEWFERKFDMNIVKIENNSEKLYHLDCMVYPLYNNVVMAVTSNMSKKNIRDIEKFAHIVDVPKDIGGWGTTNCVGLHKTLLCASDINDLKVTDDDYKFERAKVDFLTKTCAEHGLEPIFFNLSEYKKNGADLSCMVMHMNYTRFSESY